MNGVNVEEMNLYDIDTCLNTRVWRGFGSTKSAKICHSKWKNDFCWV